MEITIGRKFNFFGGPVPVLYTDSIDGQQVGRDDLFIATTEHLMQPGDARPVTSLTIAEIDAEIERLQARIASLELVSRADHAARSKLGYYRMPAELKPSMATVVTLTRVIRKRKQDASQRREA